MLVGINTVIQFGEEINIYGESKGVISVLGLHPQETHLYKKTYTRVFITAIFIIGKIGNDINVHKSLSDNLLCSCR